MNTGEYVIRAQSEGYNGNDLVFWQVGGGYTSKLDKANRFTKEQAAKMHQMRDSDLPMLYDVLNEIASKTVDMQLLPTYEEELSVLHLTVE
tara:strand:- start:232 stop:504 length:273 start_codon:yes stop_codon:yes gene_type:complete